MDRGYQHSLTSKLLSEISKLKTHRNWKSSLLKQNRKEERDMLSFVTQYQPLSTIKEKVESSYKTIHYFATFLENHLLFPTRKENHGKEPAEEPPREQRFLSCMAFSVLACQATRTTS